MEYCDTYGECVDDISDDPAYDVARAKWGSGWRMPTEPEFKELIDACKWKWVVLVGKNGYMVTGPNGNSIFLPAAGYRDESKLEYKGKMSRYWGGTSDKSDSMAVCLKASDRYHKISYYYRWCGLSVRPVSELRM